MLHIANKAVLKLNVEMRQLLHVLWALLPVCTIGRGNGGGPSLRSQQIASPSPAELEEQEEVEGTREQDVENISHEQQPQQNGFMQLPPQPAPQAMATKEVLQSADSKKLALEAAVPSLPSLIADGVAGPSLPQDKAQFGGPPNAADNVKPVGDSDRGSAERDDAEETLGETPSKLGHNANVPEASASHVSVTVPGVASPRSKDDAGSISVPLAKFSPNGAWGPNSSAADRGTAFQADPVSGFDPIADAYSKCNPPCIAGRGICNDNVCWCKTPYSGTTCQHKVGELQRVAFVFVIAFSAICIILGVVLAQGVFALISRWMERRMASMGKHHSHAEVWTPPEGKYSKARGHAEGAHDHEIPEH